MSVLLALNSVGFAQSDKLKVCIRTDRARAHDANKLTDLSIPAQKYLNGKISKQHNGINAG